MNNDQRKILEKYINNGEYENINKILHTLIKEKTFVKISKLSGLGRESLYKAVKPDATMQFCTFLKILKTLNVNLRLELEKEEERNV